MGVGTNEGGGSLAAARVAAPISRPKVRSSVLPPRAISPAHALFTPAPRFSGPTAARAAQC